MLDAAGHATAGRTLTELVETVGARSSLRDADVLPLHALTVNAATRHHPGEYTETAVLMRRWAYGSVCDGGKSP
jgi:hypothetical protein